MKSSIVITTYLPSDKQGSTTMTCDMGFLTLPMLTLLCDDIPRAMATPIYAQMLETVGATGIVMRATGGAIPELLLMGRDAAPGGMYV